MADDAPDEAGTTPLNLLELDPLEWGERIAPPREREEAIPRLTAERERLAGRLRTFGVA